MEKKPQVIAKENEVAELQGLFTNCQAAILTDYRGISVSEDVTLRAKLREAGIEYRVAKNTLLKIACNNSGNTELDTFLSGPTAIAFADDPVAAAKILSEFAKSSKKTEIKAGLLNGQFMDAASVESLAKLPSREVLLAQVAGGLVAPMSSFAGVLSGMLRQVVTVFDAVREQKSA